MMNYLVSKDYKEINYSAEEMVPLLENNKVVVLKNYGLDRDPLEFFTEFSDKLGYIYNVDESVETGEATGKRWIDITYDPAIKDKYRTAPVGQPLHTDASYIDIKDNIQFFYCVGAAKMGGATIFIDSRFLVDLFEPAGEGELLESLMEQDVTFSKGLRNRREPIIQKDGDDWRLNWNYFCGDKGNQESEKKLVERFHTFLETRVVRSGLVTEVMLKKNDAVFFHDELVLHGRNSYFATEKGQRSLNKGTIILESRFGKNAHLNLDSAVENS